MTPHIVCSGAADAIEFYKKAFNAVEVARLPGPDGKLMHAEVRIGDSTVMLVDESPDWGCHGPRSLKGSPVTLHLYVDDVDGVVAQPSAREPKSRSLSMTCSGATATASWRTHLVTNGR